MNPRDRDEPGVPREHDEDCPLRNPSPGAVPDERGCICWERDDEAFDREMLEHERAREDEP